MKRLLVLLLLAPALARADVIKTKDGRALEGRIVEETAEKIVIEVERKGGKAKMTVPQANVASVERGPTPREKYESRAAKLGAADWAAELELAKYCAEKGLAPEAAKHMVHIVTESAGAPQAIEARAALLKMGWRDFPGEGWKAEDAFWGPKGFVRRGGRWVTSDWAEADAAVEKAEKALRDFRKKGDYLAGLGEYAREYRSCIDGWNDLHERQAKLAEEIDEQRRLVLSDLQRITVIELSVDEIDQLAYTEAGDLVTNRGVVVIVKSRQDTAEWRIYEGHQAELLRMHAEDKSNREEMATLVTRTQEILAKAKSEGKVLRSAEGEEKKLEEALQEHEIRREAKRMEMADRLGENGFPK